MVYLFVIIGIIAFTIAIIVLSKTHGFKFPLVQFFVKGKEFGYRGAQIKLLRRIAIENKLSDPLAIFWSKKVVKQCLRALISDMTTHNLMENILHARKLAGLFEVMRIITMKYGKVGAKLQNTHAIRTGQTLNVCHPNGGEYISKIIENNRRYISIQYPEDDQQFTSVSWENQPITINFWRKDDAQYSFETDVLGDFFEENKHILHVHHAPQKYGLQRVQQRKTVRKPLSVNGTIFLMHSKDECVEKFEKTGGYRCRFTDISEEGAAVIIGGHAIVGAHVRVQVVINDMEIPMCCTIVGVQYKKEHNVSKISLQSLDTGILTRNKIASFVFNIFDDDNDADADAEITAASDIE